MLERANNYKHKTAKKYKQRLTNCFIVVKWITDESACLFVWSAIIYPKSSSLIHPKALCHGAKAGRNTRAGCGNALTILIEKKTG